MGKILEIVMEKIGTGEQYAEMEGTMSCRTRQGVMFAYDVATIFAAFLALAVVASLATACCMMLPEETPAAYGPLVSILALLVSLAAFAAVLVLFARHRYSFVIARIENGKRRVVFRDYGLVADPTGSVVVSVTPEVGLEEGFYEFRCSGASSSRRKGRGMLQQALLPRYFKIPFSMGTREIIYAVPSCGDFVADLEKRAELFRLYESSFENFAGILTIPGTITTMPDGEPRDWCEAHLIEPAMAAEQRDGMYVYDFDNWMRHVAIRDKQRGLRNRPSWNDEGDELMAI